MPPITSELLAAYLDDALGQAESARVEQALRESDELRGTLRALMQDVDRGEHSLGAIWRRERLSCPSREQLGNLLLDVLDEAESAFIRFHLEVIGCPFCTANMEDLRARQAELAPQARARQQRFVASSADLLRSTRRSKN